MQSEQGSGVLFAGKSSTTGNGVPIELFLRDSRTKEIESSTHRILTREFDGIRPHSLIPDSGASPAQFTEGWHQAVQEALKESEERFRSIVDEVSIGLSLRDLKGRSIVMNPALYRMHGYTEAEMKSKGIPDFVPPEDRERILATYASVVSGETPFVQGETRFVRKDGSTGWAHYAFSLLRDRQGKPLYALSVIEDITERRLAREQLQETVTQLRALAAHLQTVREDERISLAREVHDELGQALTGLKMDVSWLRKRACTSDKNGLPCPLLPRLEAMPQLINSTIETVREIANQLRPPVLDTLGLLPALKWQARVFSERTGIVFRIDFPVESVQLCQACETAIFRIFQETLTNVARHAQATHIEVVLREEDGIAKLEIKDNGVGIKPKQTVGARSLGLMGMRERALVMGGEVNITSAPGSGTCVSVHFSLQCPHPLQDQQSEVKEA